jgi:EAL domain-containing protein (putative c-di-GMP-specific phosphodiesterase class I)
MNVIAEGVETEDQKRLLKKERCHCVQGYIYNKPLSSQECLKYMRAYARK